MHATSTIPIVFSNAADPVDTGLVTRIDRPTGNATGLTSLSSLTGPKRMELLGEIVPAPAPLGLLINPENLIANDDIRKIQDAAQAKGRKLAIFRAKSANEVDAAIAAAAVQQVPAEPPAGAVDGITIISPFLSPDFLKKAGKWGTAGSRTLISSMPALADMASRSSKSLTGFSKILAYAAPDVLADESTLPLPGNEPVIEDDVEPAPLALHAKIFCFHSGENTILRVGSANATERAWSGRNSEIMVELEAGEAFTSGLAFLVGKATPVTIDELVATDPRSMSAADALEESRKALMASWNPVLRRDGECFSIDAGAVPSLAYPDHVLHAGPANGDLLAWPADAVHLGLGPIPLSLQSAFIQARISGPDGALRWMQRVTVDPPLEEQRDLAALASHMGLRVFHDWMRAMLGGDTLPVGGGAWDEDAGSPGNRPQSPGYDRLTLEDILTAWPSSIRRRA